MITNWTPEQDAQLAEMIGEGKSASRVAIAMNRSRNAVMGRAFRKKLQFKGQIATKSRKFASVPPAELPPKKVRKRRPKGSPPTRILARFTPDEDQTIRDMAATRKSGSDIAAVLSRSKSSVIKRARIIGAKLKGKDGPKPSAKPKAPTVKSDKRHFHPGNIANKRESRTHDPVFKHTTPSVPLKPLMVALVDLRPNMCRFPVAGERADTLFCGHPMEQGSYCRSHARLSYQAPEMRRKAA